MTPLYKLNKIIIASLATLLLSGCGNSGKQDIKKETKKKVDIPVDTTLQNRLQKFAGEPRCDGKFGFYVYDLTADKPVYGCNEKLSQPTASCMKLLSGVAGLHLMGTKYSYQTSVYTHGKTVNGILHGDIIFKADLDPQLLAPDLKDFARALKAKGITSFDGKLVADVLLKEPVKPEQHWFPWDLSFSKYGILYKGSDRLVRDLKYAFRNAGFTVRDSQVVMGTIPEGSQLVYTHKRPIEAVIQRMWKNSSNTQATSMLFTIGHRANPKATPSAAGVDYLRRFLRNDLGQKDTSLIVHDGCGLCIHNRLSPYALTQVLRYGYAHKDIYNMLMRQLAVSGVDGTLHGMMSGPKTRGKIHAKTGTLSHPFGISSLAGYCKGSNGHTLAFTILDSEMSVLDARVLQKKLCEALVK